MRPVLVSDPASDVEVLAQVLHESGREAVEKALVYRSDLPVKPFCEWADLPEDAREGRRIQARYLTTNAEVVIALLSGLPSVRLLA